MAGASWPGDRITQAFELLQRGAITHDEFVRLKDTALQLGRTDDSDLSSAHQASSETLSTCTHALNTTLTTGMEKLAAVLTCGQKRDVRRRGARRTDGGTSKAQESCVAGDANEKRHQAE